MHVDEALGKLQEMLALPETTEADWVRRFAQSSKEPLRRPGDALPARMEAMKGQPATDFGLADAYALIERNDIRVAFVLAHPADFNPATEAWLDPSEPTDSTFHWRVWGAEVFFTEKIDPHHAYLFGAVPDKGLLLQPVEWCSMEEWDAARSKKPTPEFPGDPGVCPACHQVLGSGMVRPSDEPKGNIPVDPETGKSIIVERVGRKISRGREKIS